MRKIQQFSINLWKYSSLHSSDIITVTNMVDPSALCLTSCLVPQACKAYVWVFVIYVMMYYVNSQFFAVIQIIEALFCKQQGWILMIWCQSIHMFLCVYIQKEVAWIMTNSLASCYLFFMFSFLSSRPQRCCMYNNWIVWPCFKFLRNTKHNGICVFN